MKPSSSRRHRIEVIIDTGRFGEAHAIQGDEVAGVCDRAEALLRLVIESGLSCTMEIRAPDPEHGQIRAYLEDVGDEARRFRDSRPRSLETP